MEIIQLSKQAIKIKGKKSSLVFDPDTTIKGKIPADAIVSHQENLATEKVEGSRVLIRGVGEYEVGGIKISGVKNGKHFAYKVFVDNVSVGVAHANDIEGLKDTLNGQNILLLSVGEKIDMSLIASLEPSVVILYGEKAEEVAPKEAVKTSKFLITREKLPEKMEIILLQ